MARLQRRVLPSQPFVANRTFFRAAVRFHDRLFTLAVVALCWAGYAAGGMPSMPGPARPLFSRPLRSFIIFFSGCPPGPRRIPSGRVGAVSTRARAPAGRSGAHPRRRPRRAQGWSDGADLCGVQCRSRDRRSAARRARRRVHPEHQWVRLLPSALSGAWSAVADGDADGGRARPSGRWTALHYAAYNDSISVGAELLVGGADQTITNKDG